MKLHGNYNSQNSNGYKKLLTSVAISSQTYFSIHRSADRTVKNYRLEMFNVRYKTGVDLCLLFGVS